MLLCLFQQLSHAQVDSTLLSEQTKLRFELVPEFKFILQEANKLGVKVYLFGGTASAFAHYVRWDLEREAGDTKYQAERFDYDFTNIYRGNQDLDIVVDGTSQQADQLKAIFQKEYPHFVGDREAWEVRLLRESRGDKRALLGDEEFKKQHSDTNSTGMLLLNPDEGGIVYNDLLNWGSPDSDFLNDVAEAKIKFLYGTNHKETQRYKDGLNPPVLAAIRYLAKLAQYEVEGTDADLKTVIQIIAATDFNKLSEYGKKKAEEFALKTLLNAPDSEYAWNLLEKTGARTKLIEMDGERFSEVESLSWWMNKEPLRSKPLGKEGKTARQIFNKEEIIVAHETNSFKAYDNITRSSKGAANAFISRSKISGEAAAFGDGFYTQVGLEGARGTGLTIRFKLHPDAREGVDFTYSELEYVVVHNKNALTLIPENLDISMTDFAKLLYVGDIDRTDRGLIEKFKRKFSRQDHQDSEEFLESFEILKERFFIAEDFPKKYQFVMDEAEDFNELIDSYYKGLTHYYNIKIRLEFLSKPELYLGRADWLKQIILKGNIDKYIPELLTSEEWSEHPELIELLIEQGEADSEIVKHILASLTWKNHPEWVQHYIDMGKFDLKILAKVISQDHWIRNSEWIQYFVDKNEKELNETLAKKIFSHPYWANHIITKAFITRQLRKGTDERTDVIFYILSKKEWVGEQFELDVINQLIKDSNSVVRSALLRGSVFSKDFWHKHPKGLELIKKLINSHTPIIDKYDVREIAFDSGLSSERWLENPDFIDFIYKELENMSSKNTHFIVKYLFSRKHWQERSDFISKLVPLVESSYTALHENIIESVMTRMDWQSHPTLIPLLEQLIQKNSLPVLSKLARMFLEKKKWIELPQTFILIEAVLKKKNIPIVNRKSTLQEIHFNIFKILNDESFKNKKSQIIPFLLRLIPKLNQKNLEKVTRDIFTKDDWIFHEKSWEIFVLLQKYSSDETKSKFFIVFYSYHKNKWSSHPHALKYMKYVLKDFKNDVINREFIKNILISDDWMANDETISLIPHFIEREKLHLLLLNSFLSFYLNINFKKAVEFLTTILSKTNKNEIKEKILELLNYDEFKSRSSSLTAVLDDLISKGIKPFSTDIKIRLARISISSKDTEIFRKILYDFLLSAPLVDTDQGFYLLKKMILHSNDLILDKISFNLFVNKHYLKQLDDEFKNFPHVSKDIKGLKKIIKKQNLAPPQAVDLPFQCSSFL